MEETETGMGTGLGVLMFVAGAMIGAGLALLYAPKTGRELREKVSDMTGDAMTKFKEFSADAQDKIKSTLNRGKEMAEEKGAALSGKSEPQEATFH